MKTIIPVHSPTSVAHGFGEATAQRWTRIHITHRSTPARRALSPERKALWWLIAGQVLIMLAAIILHLVGLA